MMTNMPGIHNTTPVLQSGDCLKLLSGDLHTPGFPSNTVDLIYLDPPYNSGRPYNRVIEDSMAHEHAYDDTWKWGPASQQSFDNIQDDRVKMLLNTVDRSQGKGSRLAYLCMMSDRLIELYRVLKETGSLYLHCDSTESHYLKVILDLIGFRFQSEIIWQRTKAHNKKSRKYGRIHDAILFCTKSENYTWNEGFHQKEVEAVANGVDEDGRSWRWENATAPGVRHGDSGAIWRGCDPTARRRNWQITDDLKEEYRKITTLPLIGSSTEMLELLLEVGLILLPEDPSKRLPKYKFYIKDPLQGPRYQDIWTDINLSSKESTAFMGQKPLALLERIIATSSNEGDLVLDPFFGSGTTGIAAQRLNRRCWGMELSSDTLEVARQRSTHEFGEDSAFKELHDNPQDAKSAKSMSEGPDGRKKFELWACLKMGGRHSGKQGSDSGVDGYLTLKGFGDNSSRRAAIQAKSGPLKGPQIRQFKTDLEVSGCLCGVIVCFRSDCTNTYEAICLSLGTYTTGIEGDNRVFPIVQCVFVEDILDNRRDKGGALFPGWVEPPNPEASPAYAARQEQEMIFELEKMFARNA